MFRKRAVLSILLLMAGAVRLLGQNQSDLSISVTGTPSVIFTGQNVTYTLAISNAGPADAVNLWIADAVPPETTFISSIPAPLLSFPNQIAVSMGGLPAGATTNVSVVFQTTITGSITNFVYVFADTPDPITTNNVASTINVVSDSLYASLSTFADGLGILITNNANAFSGYTNWASTNFASENDLISSASALNATISNNSAADALAYSILAGPV